MKLKRVQIGLECALALILMGIGHYYVSTLRDVYPVDGYVFYTLALIVFVHVWHATRNQTDPAGSALRDSFRTGWRMLRAVLVMLWRNLRDLLPLVSLRTQLALALALNVVAAILALVLPQLLFVWLIVWLGSIGLLIVPRLPRSIFRATPQRSATWLEPPEVIGRKPAWIGLLMAIGLLIAGQYAMATSDTAFQSPLALAINDALKLGLPNPAAALTGFMLLIVGTALFAIVTRFSAVIDRPRISIDAPALARRRLGNRWLVVIVVGFVVWGGVIKAIDDGAQGWAGVVAWLISLGLIALCWRQFDRARGVRLSIKIDRMEAIGLGIAAVIILIVLAYRLGDIPNSLWGDEGAFFSTARDIAAGTRAVDFFGLGTYGTFPAPASLFQSIFIAVFGANIAAWRLGSVVAAWLAIFPLYFLARATLGRRVAWLSIALYAVLPYLLTYARIGYNNSQSIAPVALTLLLTWLAIRRGSPFFAFVAGCVGGLGILTYTAAEIGALLALGWLAWVWLVRSAPRRSIALAGSAYILGSVMVVGPPLAFQSVHSPQMLAYKQVESIFANVIYARDLFPDDQLFASADAIQVGNQGLFYNPTLYAVLLGRGVIRTALSFHLSDVLSENYLVGALAEPIGAIYLLGLGFCLVRLRRPGYAIWPAWLIVGALTLSVVDTYPPRAAHMLPVVAAIAVLGALGLVAGVDILSHVVGELPDRFKSIVLIGAVIVLGIFGLRTYFIEMPDHFPPDLENTMFWQAQSMPRGSDITLIQPEGLSDEFVPWGLRELDLGVTFHLVKPAEVATIDLRRLCPNICRFYFVPANYGQVYPELMQAFGNGSLSRYFDARQAVEAYGFEPKPNGQ